MLALSDDRQTVRISHLSFFGHRHDTYVHIDDIVPMSGLKGGSQLMKLEVLVNKEDNEDSEHVNVGHSEKGSQDKPMVTDETATFFCSFQYGRIVNNEDYKYVFGATA